MTTQQVLTAAFEVSAIASVAYIGFALATFISRIDTRKPSAAPVPAVAPVEPTPPPVKPPVVRVAAKALPSPVVTLAVSPEVESENLSSKGAKELREIARARGIRTRAKDANRRLNKAELLAALS